MKQTTKFTGSGSFLNFLMSNNSSIPVIGKGATILHYSDRSVAEVVEVSEDGKTCVIEHLEAYADTSKTLGNGHQEWIYKPTGQFQTITYRNGGWKVKKDGVAFTKEFEQANKGAFSLANCLTDEQRLAVYDGAVWPKNVVEGITRAKTFYSPINILFGQKDYYYDWSF